jgi:8-oxo-dGTP diphosphatase
MNKPRHTRYQGAILRDHHILLIKHHFHTSGQNYWLVPGGGIEPGETEEDCLRRELKEETGLEVAVERLILEEMAHPQDDTYRVYKTYVCSAVGGDAQPGYEPEPEAASAYTISEVGWFDLRDEAQWDDKIKGDPVTYPVLIKLRAALGYL